MKKRRKSYTDYKAKIEYEAKIVVAAIKGRLTVNQLASQYGIDPNTIAEWKQQALGELPACAAMRTARYARERCPRLSCGDLE
jgi:transposase-like protein